MRLQRFERQQLQARPWKNGGGLTCEIACHPPGAGLHDFDWRLSIARIASDGPFSRFDGVDRITLLLDGPGLRLTGPGVDHRLDRPLQPWAFAGEQPLQAQRLGGDCEDFNLMWRRGACVGRVSVPRAATACTASPSGLLLAVHGHWQANGHLLVPGQGLWWEEAGPAWALVPQEVDAALIAVAIEHPSRTGGGAHDGLE